MSEPIIHDSTPKGSAILAYGESPRRSSIPIILALAAGMIAVACIATLVAVSVSDAVPLPADTISILYLKADATLPTDTPSTWSSAQSTAKPFPILVGYRRDSDGSVKPFAILPRCFGSGGQTTWALRLTDERISTKRVSLLDLAGSIRTLIAPSWLRIWPRRAFPDLDSTPDDASVGGALTPTSWNTDVKSPASHIDGDIGRNTLDIEAFPGAWPVVESSFRARGLDLRLTERPVSASWSMDLDTRMTVSLTFSEGLSAKTKAEIAGSLGISSLTPIALDDGTPINELAVDETAFVHATSIRGIEDVEAVFLGPLAIIGPIGASLEALPMPQSCTGQVLAAFDIAGIRDSLTERGIPTFPGSPKRLLWTTGSGTILACW
ncbi:hypothetical protein KJ781_02990 [Patescibacteria group bacterium]|nr:hypothetical protein [Patescibacteria group bacterium]MBU1448955.1 hypothetical protein [Patescibacteria group bacterium]MBU2613323.1 hypothetical protein [Patescibacteria group bacterium]